MGSIARVKATESVETPSNITVPTGTIPVPNTVRVNQTPNKVGPDDRLQIAEQLLYEGDFLGDTYVSAHLQRLQHGLYDSPYIHGDRRHVTFVAIAFTFHPSFSVEHRFKSAIINITAQRSEEHTLNGKVNNLRFIKYAPHLAFGRMSSESLKWNFQLGASLGVTKGPVNLSVNPSGSYEKDKILGAMMKIQGSTRSISIEHHKPERHGIQDRKLVWSLEENDQQLSGLPRELTFVFLVEQPQGPTLAETYKPITLGIHIKPNITGFGIGRLEHTTQYTEIIGEVGQNFLDHDHNCTQGAGPVRNLSGNSTVLPHEKDEDELVQMERVDFRDSIELDIQKGIYNFATMPGNFEDLVEMPGNAITSTEPSLPS